MKPPYGGFYIFFNVILQIIFLVIKSYIYAAENKDFYNYVYFSNISLYLRLCYSYVIL